MLDLSNPFNSIAHTIFRLSESKDLTACIAPYLSQCGKAIDQPSAVRVATPCLHVRLKGFADLASIL